MGTKRVISKLVGGGCVVVVGLGCGLQPTNPFDPDAPPELRAAGTLVGRVQAVFAPIDPADGEACVIAGAPVVCTPGDDTTGCCVPEASFCDEVQGDHSGFQLVLRSLDDDDAAAAIRAASTETNELGAFAFINIRPGPYSLEIVREGFTVPLPRTVEVLPGDTTTLGDLCGINANAPASPVLGLLPPVLRASPGLTLPDIVIADCAPGLVYTVRQQANGVADEVVVNGDGAVDGTCAVPAAFAPAGDRSDRWSIAVTATDALGNTSGVTEATVVLDGDAPEVPCGVTVDAAQDRVLVRFGALASVDDDGDGVADGVLCQRQAFDDEARWLVSYTLAERPATAACPADIDGDDFDIAELAVEGPSPVVAASPLQTISGLLPGTDLFVQVAAVDAVGNPSCWSPVVRVRPDVVTPGLLDQVVLAPLGVQARADADGLTVFARGSGGVTSRSSAGALVEHGGVSLDVVLHGEAAYSAAGALGVQRFATVGGALQAPTTVIIDDSRSLALVPGGLLVGTATGVRLIDPAAVGGAPAAVDPGAIGQPTAALAVSDGLVALAREGDVLQLVALDNLADVLGEAPIAGTPTALRFIDDEVWVASGNTVDVVPVAGCLDGGQCPGTSLRFQVPPGLDATDVVAWDDLVLVLGSPRVGSADPGGVLVYTGEARAPRLVGRAFAPAGSRDLTSLVVQAGGFCMTGTFDDVAGERCFETVRFPVASAQVPLIGTAVVQSIAVGPHAFTLGRAGDTTVVSRFRLADGEERARRTAPDGDEILSLAAVPGQGAFVIDEQLRLGFMGEQAAGDDVIDVIDDTIIAAAVGVALDDQGAPGLPVRSAHLAIAGEELVLVVHATDVSGAACRAPLLVRIDLGRGPGGALDVVDATVRASATPVLRVIGLDVAQGLARVATEPFAVQGFDSVGFDVDAAASIAAAEACGPAGVTRVRAFGRTGAGAGQLLASGVALQGGVPLDALYDVTGGSAAVLLSDATTPLSIFARVRDFLAVGTASQLLLVDIGPGAPTDSLRPVLALPGLVAVPSAVATGRGLLLSGGTSGALFVPLR